MVGTYAKNNVDRENLSRSIGIDYSLPVFSH